MTNTENLLYYSKTMTAANFFQSKEDELTQKSNNTCTNEKVDD